MSEWTPFSRLSPDQLVDEARRFTLLDRRIAADPAYASLLIRELAQRYAIQMAARNAERTQTGDASE